MFAEGGKDIQRPGGRAWEPNASSLWDDGHTSVYDDYVIDDPR